MGRKAGITADDVAVAAAAIADRDGLEAATLTAVAADLGIQTPSLYNHVRGTLVLVPGSKPDVASLRMAPVDGYQLLAQIEQGALQHA